MGETSRARSRFFLSLPLVGRDKKERASLVSTPQNGRDEDPDVVVLYEREREHNYVCYVIASASEAIHGSNGKNVLHFVCELRGPITTGSHGLNEQRNNTCFNRSLHGVAMNASALTLGSLISQGRR
jgi:hypothetical protein